MPFFFGWGGQGEREVTKSKLVYYIHTTKFFLLLFFFFTYSSGTCTRVVATYHPYYRVHCCVPQYKTVPEGVPRSGWYCERGGGQGGTVARESGLRLPVCSRVTPPPLLRSDDRPSSRGVALQQIVLGLTAPFSAYPLATCGDPDVPTKISRKVYEYVMLEGGKKGEKVGGGGNGGGT